VNRDSGTDSANGGWLRRLVRHQNPHNSQKPVIANLSAASCSPLETGASYSSKLETSGYRLKPKTAKPKSRRIAVGFRTTKISSQNHRQISGVRLMPNEKS
jgi:hypothetical protein